MKRTSLKALALSALCCVLMTPASQAQPQQKQQPLSSEELTSRSIQRGAVEAVVWGMPAVNFERMLEARGRLQGLIFGGLLRKNAMEPAFPCRRHSPLALVSVLNQ
jgi:hypothetical protein